MELVIITGMSGAGKTSAMHALEDIDFNCVDNLPPELITTFYDLCSRSNDEHLKHLALVMDIRSVDMYEKFCSALMQLRREKKPYKILFIDAKDEVIANRYKETRRKHPLSSDKYSSISEVIEVERCVLQNVKRIADYLIDSTYLSSAQLKERVLSLFLENASDSLSVTVMSFGFKYAPANEADIVFDVRCLPNPYYVEELKHKTGLNSEVYNYVMDNEKTKGLVERLVSLIDYTIPLYVGEGKSQLVIAIGCTGGKHRSVSIAEYIYKHLKENNIKTAVHHRDINKR